MSLVVLDDVESMFDVHVVLRGGGSAVYLPRAAFPVID